MRESMGKGGDLELGPEMDQIGDEVDDDDFDNHYCKEAMGNIGGYIVCSAYSNTQ